MTFELRRSLTIERNIDEVFEFFSKAENLERITPPHLNFKILTPKPIAMGEGTIIDYQLSLYKVPFKWKTLIRSWNPPHEFIDEQLKGPYTSWVHLHRFEQIDTNATLMTDYVQYSIFGGKLAHFLVKRDVEKIFSYRNNQILKIFPNLTIKETADSSV
jgi:ligand-binding SRPBCC domain-containing protein